MSKQKYIIVRDSITDTLEKKVNEKLELGYELYGFPFRHLNGNTNTTYQAMILKEN